MLVEDEDGEAALTRDALAVRGELVGEVYLLSIPGSCCRESSFRRVVGVRPGPPEGAGVVNVATGPLLRVWLLPPPVLLVRTVGVPVVRVAVDIITFGLAGKLVETLLLRLPPPRMGEYSVLLEFDEIRLFLFKVVDGAVAGETVRSESPPSAPLPMLDKG